ncbi:hypothetical protein E2553_16055 [Paraburkholderia dipogonis]|uniref:Uncharacterized protein n=1 Tax=Paraburkholderia dipogonis TaxID=1211383 RepID=A0A4Y8N9G5_9BURK|nr:hypothetical protein [Paraburkholderia dipogonis]TFE46410.1 hypothetical protein E2553_16055 [Paraburkholderia dipogonis]
MNNPWSETLIEQTRGALQSLPVTLDGNLHLKNADDRFGHIGLRDLMTGTLTVTDKRSGETHLYGSVDDLIAAGWAVD